MELDYFEGFSEDEADLVPVIGHPASFDAFEAEALGKMLALGAAALADIASGVSMATAVPTASWGLYIALPNYSLRRGPYVDLRNVGNSAPARDEEEIPGLASVEFAANCNAHLQARLLRASGWSGNVRARQFLFGDHVSFPLAIAAAMRDLESGTVERCLVGGFDSYLDPDTLDWALDEDRLKSDSQPCGFAPGEAAVFLELVTPELAASAGLPVKAYLHAPQFEREAQLRTSETGPQGRALAAAVARALNSPAADERLLVIADLNGEVARSQDWGYAVNRLVADFPALRDAAMWFPASAFGETGCASSALATAIAMHAFERDYAHADRALIVSSSDAGPRAAFLVSRS